MVSIILIKHAAVLKTEDSLLLEGHLWGADWE